MRKKLTDSVFSACSVLDITSSNLSLSCCCGIVGRHYNIQVCTLHVYAVNNLCKSSTHPIYYLIINGLSKLLIIFGFQNLIFPIFTECCPTLLATVVSKARSDNLCVPVCVLLVVSKARSDNLCVPVCVCAVC